MTSCLRALLGPAVLSILVFAPPISGQLVAGSPPARDSRTGTRTENQSAAPADAKTKPAAKAEDAAEIPTINVLDGIRNRQLAVEAEGTGDGRMTLSVTNRTSKKLRVVLPPGLIASSATGQFGGMGGGMGGMGGMGGGMGGMGGGMGGMGGGMGGMGGGMGGMGGGMGGMGGGMGMMGGGTMPASMGMMMLGRLIMTLVGDRDSWDQASLMSGMAGMGGGGMGGGGMGGMGGMGGGMGGMGGGMGGGGGWASVPPTSLPMTTLKPKQTRHLPTVVASLNGPDAEEHVVMPAKGEKLRIGDIDKLTRDVRIQAALKRLAKDKAPQTIAQLVLWNVASGLEWKEIDRLSKGWANGYELALARQLVRTLDASEDALSTGDSGLLYWDVTVKDAGQEPLAAELRKLLAKSGVLGLKTQRGIPERPEGPALACLARFDGRAVEVQMLTTDDEGTAWVKSDAFPIKLGDADDKPSSKATKVADSLAEGLLSRLVRAELTKGPKVKGKLTYKIRIENASPLILNGLALAGTEGASKDHPKMLAGLCIPPRKSWSVPATSEQVEALKLKQGLRVSAADLSGL